MSSTPLLNLDALCEVAYAADRRTCASLMLTCKSLKHAAAKSALQQQGGNYLWYTRDVILILRFLYAHPSRFEHVRELHIGFTDLPSELFEQFLEGLSQMTHLKTLGIPCGDITLERLPRLSDAIASIRTIRRLEVRSAGDATCRLLTKMEADLTSISLDWLEREGDFFSVRFHSSGCPEWASYHPVPFLSKWSATLEELKCLSWFTCPTGLPKFPQTYPKLRRLSIDRDETPRVEPYIRAYPNLAQLTVETDYNDAYDRDPDANAVQQLHDHRAINIRSQEDGDGDGCGTWPHLEAVTASLIDLYILGITCRILQLHIGDGIDHRHLELLPPVLTYAQPRHLKIQGDALLVLDPSFGVTKLLRESCAARLESLMLGLDLFPEDFDGHSIPSVLGDLANTLRCLPLRRLRLHIDVSGLDPTPSRLSARDFMLARHHGQPEPLPPPPAPFTDLEQSLRSVNLDAYIRDLVSAIPSLEDVVMCVERERNDEFVPRTRSAEFVRVRRVEYADKEMYEW